MYDGESIYYYFYYCQTFEMKGLIGFYVLKSFQSKKPHLKWLVCVCVDVSAYVFYQNKCKTNYSRKCKCGIRHLYDMKMLPEKLCATETNNKQVYTGHGKILKNMGGISY